MCSKQLYELVARLIMTDYSETEGLVFNQQILFIFYYDTKVRIEHVFMTIYMF